MELSSLSNRLKRNVIVEYFLKGCSMLIGIYSLKINLGYLGNDLYGLWATISAVAGWVAFLDLGVGNGLRNELSKAFAENDIEKQKSLIVTGIVTLAYIVVFLFCGLSVCSEILIHINIFSVDLRLPIYITNVFFCLNFILGLVGSIAFAFQEGWIGAFSNIVGSILRILAVIILTACVVPASLCIFSFVNGISGSIGCILAIFVLCFRIKLKFYRKNILSYYCEKYKKDITNIGLLFFILQLIGIIRFAMDNVIIHDWFNDEMVTKYSIITTVFMSGNALFSIILSHFWSAVTVMATVNNYAWIQKVRNKVLVCWLGYSVGCVIVAIWFNDIVRVWLNNGIEYESLLLLSFCLYNIFMALNGICVTITNGLGRLSLQIRTAIITAFAYPLLVYLLVKVLNLELAGFKFANIICVVFEGILIAWDVTTYIGDCVNKTGN